LVYNSVDISWRKDRVFVSEVFRNEEIGLEQMDEDMHGVFFRNTERGKFNSSQMRFRPVLRARLDSLTTGSRPLASGD
jgi:hypothetical protein